MQNEAGDSFFLERALFLAENFISRSSMHQKIFCLAGKLDLDERKLFIITKHTLFSTIRLPQLAAGHVSVLQKNRQLFSWGVCRSHVTYSPEIVPLTVFTTQNGLASALSYWKKVLWFGSYCIAKLEKFQKMDVWEWLGDAEVVHPQSCNKMHATAWRASLHHNSTSHAKKRWKCKRLPLLSNRKVHPKVSQKFHSGGGCALEVPLVEFVDSVCAACTASTLWSCLIFIHKEMQGFAGFRAFQCAQRVPPQWAKIFTVGGWGCALEVPLVEFIDSVCAYYMFSPLRV